jgi:hypothetical protein
MTQDEIIEMARQARLMSEYDEASPWVEDHEITQYVEAFAKLVAAKAIAELESQERNFCPRCGKRTNDIHTCTPPQRTEQEPQIAINAQVVGYVEPQRTWVGLTDEEVESYWGWEDFQCGCGKGTLLEMVRDIEAALKERNT